MSSAPSTYAMFTRLALRSPIGSARSAYVGLRAALRVPMWVTGSRLRSTLEQSVDEGGCAEPDEELIVALRVANGAIRHLSRTRVGWRNTCLYRSMAQYLVLRDFGRSAAIRIGVKGAPRHTDDRDVSAHSWVIYNGPEPVQDGGEWYEEMRFKA